MGKLRPPRGASDAHAPPVFPAGIARGHFPGFGRLLHAARRSAGGSFESGAFGVSGDGSTVVGQSVSASGVEPFVWDATNGMQSLQVLLTSLGVELSGWQLLQAGGVSDDGHTIVGVGLNPAGDLEGFIAVIPEPGTALLLGLGLALASATGLRR
jgi:hypothetical protein